jgi:aminomethyltransferase
LIDDVLVYVDSPTEFRLSHGAGTLEAAIFALAPKYDVKIEKDDDTHILALQGPLALELLQPHTPMDLANLGYFKHEPTTLFCALPAAAIRRSAAMKFSAPPQMRTRCGIRS